MDACSKLLEKLETQGVLKLPEKQISSGSSSKQILQTERTEVGELLEESVGAQGPFQVVPVTEKEVIALWNEYVNRYHYLGYNNPLALD